MDGGKFDQLARGLGAGRSRRSVVKLLGAAALGAVGVAGFRHEAEAATKVGICHATGSASNPWVYITVSTNAIPAHQAHGDTIDPNFGSDPANCGGCGIACSFPDHGYPTCGEGNCGFGCNQGYHATPDDTCASDAACEVIGPYETPICFWMENGSGNWCWVPTDYGYDECRSLDSCGGGDGNSGGGCYMWATSSAGPAIAPPWS